MPASIQHLLTAHFAHHLRLFDCLTSSHTAEMEVAVADLDLVEV